MYPQRNAERTWMELREQHHILKTHKSKKNGFNAFVILFLGFRSIFQTEVVTKKDEKIKDETSLVTILRLIST